MKHDVNELDMDYPLGIQHQKFFVQIKSNSKKMRRPLLCDKFNLIFIAKKSCWDVEQLIIVTVTIVRVSCGRYSYPII